MAGFVDLERRFAERRRTHGLRRSLELAGDGLLLGVDTVIATLAPNGEEERILALLAAAQGRAVSPHIIELVRKSVGLWTGGEKFLAQTLLAYASLPPLGSAAGFHALHGRRLFKAGMTPNALMVSASIPPRGGEET